LLLLLTVGENRTNGSARLHDVPQGPEDDGAVSPGIDKSRLREVDGASASFQIVQLGHHSGVPRVEVVDRQQDGGRVTVRQLRDPSNTPGVVLVAEGQRDPGRDFVSVDSVQRDSASARNSHYSQARGKGRQVGSENRPGRYSGPRGGGNK